MILALERFTDIVLQRLGVQREVSSGHKSVVSDALWTLDDDDVAK